MTKMQRTGSLLVSLTMIAFAVSLFAFPNEGLPIVAAVLSIALVIAGIRMFIYYFSMARHMVGGLTILCRAVILLDPGLFTATLNNIPCRTSCSVWRRSMPFPAWLASCARWRQDASHGILEAQAAPRDR